MYDNALIALIIQILSEGMTGFLPAGISTSGGTGITTAPPSPEQLVTSGPQFPFVSIKQSYQPRIEGANSGPTLYLSKIMDKRIGSPEQRQEWDKDRKQEFNTYRQQYETTFQITAWCAQNPSVTNSITAGDILNAAAKVLQCMPTVALLESKDVGILRIGDIRNLYIVDDREQFEATPSFDFVLTHKQTIVSATPYVTKTDVLVVSV